MNREIVLEIYKALETLGAQSDLLGTVGSWGDGLPDEDVLANLRAWNTAADRPALDGPFATSGELGRELGLDPASAQAFETRLERIAGKSLGLVPDE